VSFVSRRLTALPAAVVMLAMNSGSVTACDLCAWSGSSAYHVAALGGDDPDDALTAPPDLDDHTGDATASFVVAGGKWPQPGGLGSPVTITYSYQNMFDGGLRMPNGQPLPNPLIRRSIEEALGAWASAAPLHFVEVPDQGGDVPPGYPDGKFGQIRFRHIFINGPDIPGQSPIAKAQAYFPSSGGNLAGDVEFDHGDPWQEVGTLSVPDILGATIHEVGHTLGLHHTDDVGANMYWIFHRFAGPGTGQLFPDDMAGIRAIYGAGVGSVTPLHVPEPITLLLGFMAMVSWFASRAARGHGRLALYSRLPIRPL
jgi:hypothetical protein